MVAGGAPDPPDYLHDDLSPPVSSIEINNPTTDSEDEDVLGADNYAGYAPLPLAPNDDRDMIIPYNNSDSSSDSSDDDEIQEPIHNPASTTNPPEASVPAIETVDREVCRELWSGRFEASNIEMNSEKVQQVMNVMANIKLPPSSIPDWAQNISEDEWKQALVGRINTLQHRN